MLVFTYKLIYIGAESEIGDGFGGSDVPFAAAGGSGSGIGSGRGSVFTVGLGEPGSFFGIWANKIILISLADKTECEKIL